MEFNSKNLLVTGGAGFIGSNFIGYILDKYENINIINLDLLTYAGSKNNMKAFYNNCNHKFIEGDICDKKLLEDLFKKYDIDGVINFAAETHVDNSIVDPDIFIKTNINGVFNLLSVSYKYWMDSPFNVKTKFVNSRFHQISTDEVYGSIIDGSFNEKSNYSPNSPYSASKASADMLVRSFNKTYGLSTSISISSNNFGPFQNKEKFIPKIIECLFKNKIIPVYGDGLNVRNWIYVIDHCRAIDIIFNKSNSGSCYNVGGELELTNLKLIDIIYNFIQKDNNISKRIDFIQDRFGHDRRYSINSSKLKKELNWSPVYNFHNVLKDYVLSIK